MQQSKVESKLVAEIETEEVDEDEEPKTVAAVERLYNAEKKRFTAYHELAEAGERLRKEHGPLHIAGFTRLWPPPIHGKGGMQYHAQHLYSRLASLGHVVHVFTTGHPGAGTTHYFSVDHSTLKVEKSSKEEANLWVHQCPSKKNGAYSVMWYKTALDKFREVDSKIKFDVAHSESWAAVANAAQLGVPLVVTWHGSMLDWFRNEMNQIIQNYRLKGHMTSKTNADRMKSLGESVAYETFALQTVPHHIVISDSAASDLITADLIPSERVHLVYNGVNEVNFKPDKSIRSSFLSKHGVNPKHFVLGCGGRLTSEKGHGQLAKAAQLLLQDHNDITLVVAGTGSESSKYEKLKKKGLSVVLVGMLSQGDLADFYNAIDVFIDPYWQHHGLNTVMIEAALSNTPLIVTRLPSSRTTVPNPAFGQTFGLGMKQDLVRAVLYLKNNPKVRSAIGANGRERALKLFTSTVMAQKYEQVLYDAKLNPSDLPALDGEVACKETYPAMCYRMPKKDDEKPKEKPAEEIAESDKEVQ
eukprot:TRINITY_DN4486_c1_g1_i1.p1 TRINITY_DN4486_c1_g1~~TRINITY_DN4486_c1_g1_i1.p1  ORF type:complete len:609 (+),score=108.07 TRINITY_DN4486_c1_g1_i1:245-1828(+)